MAANYTNSELMRMREQAIIRAREMQGRAAIKDNAKNTQSASVTSHTSEAQKNSTNVPDKSVEHHGEDNRRIEGNTLFEKYPNPKDIFRRNPPPCPDTCPVSKVIRRGGHSSDENDRFLIMSLLIILIADGGDKMLIFALMYIMM